MSLAEAYLTIKQIHIYSVIASVAWFFVRGVMLLSAERYLRFQWVKWPSRLIDTALLTSAVMLTLVLQQYPFVNSPWLTAKVVALLLYIGLGMVALHGSGRHSLRLVAWLAALVTVGYIALVARYHHPLPPLWR